LISILFIVCSSGIPARVHSEAARQVSSRLHVFPVTYGVPGMPCSFRVADGARRRSYAMASQATTSILFPAFLGQFGLNGE
jgi:hypothetical protein